MYMYMYYFVYTFLIAKKIKFYKQSSFFFQDPLLPSILTDILTDTTSQHGSHVFDQNCDICTGKKKTTEKESLPEVKTLTPDRYSNC